jgi:hypothetical protein
MSAVKKAEHLDIHDHRNDPADNVRQNDLPVLMTKQMQHWNMMKLFPKSAVHYTYPVSMCYRLKVALIGRAKGRINIDAPQPLLPAHSNIFPTPDPQLQEATAATSPLQASKKASDEAAETSV